MNSVVPVGRPELIIGTGHYGLIQPPTRADEQGSEPLHAKENFGTGLLFGFRPRWTHANAQPRTHSIVVDPSGAFTTISKSGAELCARATQPPPNSATTTMPRKIIRATQHLLLNDYITFTANLGSPGGQRNGEM
jgi:hypothetical protein